MCNNILEIRTFQGLHIDIIVTLNYTNKNKVVYLNKMFSAQYTNQSNYFKVYQSRRAPRPGKCYGSCFFCFYSAFYQIVSQFQLAGSGFIATFTLIKFVSWAPRGGTRAPRGDT